MQAREEENRKRHPRILPRTRYISREVMMMVYKKW
jgi:hypothetical protein